MKLYMTNSESKLEEQANVDKAADAILPEPNCWQIGTYHAHHTAPALAIWPAGVEPQSKGVPICLISPLDTITEFDLINAQLIMAVPALYNAAVALIATLESECDAAYQQASRYNNNTPKVGQTLPYAAYPTLPPELEMLKKAVALATRKPA